MEIGPGRLTLVTQEALRLAAALVLAWMAILPGAVFSAESGPPGVQIRIELDLHLPGAEGLLPLLAAAGGPDVHPHATSGPEAWAVWERDVANFNADLRRIEAFFRDVLAGRLSEEEENKRLFSFINTGDVPQGAFYTVGWKMAALVERTRGREALLAALCDPRSLLAAYNEVAAAHPRTLSLDNGEGLARWSPEFLASLR